MSVTPATPRSAIAFGVFTLVMVALFTGLGLWQLQRREARADRAPDRAPRGGA